MSKISIPDYDLNMESHWTNKINRKYINYNENVDEVKRGKKLDENREVNDIQERNLNLHRSNIQMMNGKIRNFDESSLEVKHRMKREEFDPRCETFQFDDKERIIMHPHAKNGGNNYYYNNSDCVTKINGKFNSLFT